MATTVVDNIGLLITCDDTTGDGTSGGDSAVSAPMGARRDACVVFEGERIISIGRAGTESADQRIDAAGRCVIPGFVDSHTHLVFAGDRGDEFTARMAGQSYAAGGIRTTVAATRAASDAQLRQLTAARRTEARRAGVTTIEIKSGYGLTVADEVRCLDIAADITEHGTFLGAHVVPAEFDGRTDDYVHHVVTEMLPAAASRCSAVDAFCEVGAFDADQCRAVLEAGRAYGLDLHLHGNQLGHGPGVQLAVATGCRSVDHCTYLADDDIAALASSSTVATFLPATDFSTRQPYPDARRAIDAGVSVALATNCNPGSSFTTNMPFVLALAVRDLRMTADEALYAATRGGAAALGRNDIGRIAPGARADMVMLDAPSHGHFIYRPGVPLIAAVIERGALHPVSAEWTSR